MSVRTTNIIENADYFIADLTDGGVRIGLKGFCAFDFPANHIEYKRIRSLSLDDVEGEFDALYSVHAPIPTMGYAHLN